MAGPRFLHSRGVLPLLVALALGACNDDGGGPNLPEPELATMRVTVGAQVITITSDGIVNGGPIAIGAGVTPVEIAFLEEDGGPSPLVVAPAFRADMLTNDEDVVVVEREDNFHFELVAVTSGFTDLGFALTHVDANHTDFGPFVVPIAVSVGGNPN